jgi:hypothetical protein
MAIVRNRGKNARNISQKIWLSSAEADQLKAAAGDVPVATWLRDLALGKPSAPRPPARRKTARPAPKFAGAVQPLAVAVARLGNNLNQIARAVNFELKLRRPLDAALVAYQLARLRREIRTELQAVGGPLLPEASDAGADL